MDMVRVRGEDVKVSGGGVKPPEFNAKLMMGPAEVSLLGDSRLLRDMDARDVRRFTDARVDLIGRVL